jgi:hypothetical protein
MPALAHQNIGCTAATTDLVMQIWQDDAGPGGTRKICRAGLVKATNLRIKGWGIRFGRTYLLQPAC